MIISHSEVEAYQSCPKKHFFAFGLRIERKEHSDALQRGTIGHDLFSFFWEIFQTNRNLDACLKAANERAAEIMRQNSLFAEITLQAALLITNFVEENRQRISRWKVLETEKETRVDLDGYTYAFKPDLVVEDQGRIELWDYKFAYDFYYPDVANLLPQIPRYAGALRASGTNVLAGGYIFLRTRKITDPQLPKTKLFPLTMSTKRIVIALQDFDKIAQEVRIRKLLPLEQWEDEAVRNATTVNCKNCSFRSICVVEANGEDASMVKRTEFRPSTYGYIEAANGPINP